MHDFQQRLASHMADPRMWLGFALLSCMVTSGHTCSATCYKGTCDYWDGGFWGTCANLQASYGCDCSGCECDGCPDSTCDKPKFDPNKCPYSGNAGCDESENHADCAYDGGDCCEDTCIGSNCPTSQSSYSCKDPDHASKHTKLEPDGPSHVERVGEYTSTVGASSVTKVSTSAGIPSADTSVTTTIVQWQTKVAMETQKDTGPLNERTSTQIPVAARAENTESTQRMNGFFPIVSTTKVGKQLSQDAWKSSISFASRTSVTAIAFAELGLVCCLLMSTHGY